jgi:NAD(P)H-dependent flavin oxidoreductase YrpB (nitropropane dioxygenase family)
MRKYGNDQHKDTGKWIDSSVWHGKAHTWEKIPWLVKEVCSHHDILLLSPRILLLQWKRISNGRPLVIKGIQSAADAQRALRAGCEGIVVSNHAGRQVDGAVGSLEVLPEIVDAVGDS